MFKFYFWYQMYEFWSYTHIRTQSSRSWGHPLPTALLHAQNYVSIAIQYESSLTLVLSLLASFLLSLWRSSSEDRRRRRFSNSWDLPRPSVSSNWNVNKLSMYVNNKSLIKKYCNFFLLQNIFVKLHYYVTDLKFLL